MSESTDKQIAVLYHANCLDGFGAAYAAWVALGDTADYIPVTYGEPLPKGLDNKRIYLVDFSYPLPQMMELIARSTGVTVLDHHKTALPILKEVARIVNDTNAFNYVFDLEKSGAVIAWEYFNTGEQVPPMLLHIQDRDLWQFKLDGTKEICAALFSTAACERSFKNWHDFVLAGDKTLYWLSGIGRTLLADFNERCRKLVDKAYECEIRTHDYNKDITSYNKGLAINCTPEYSSELGNLLAQKLGTYGATWHYLGAGKYQVSLRSIGDYDVSIIAKYYGGGGHKNAAGFIVNKAKGQKLRLILQDMSDESK